MCFNYAHHSLAANVRDTAGAVCAGECPPIPQPPVYQQIAEQKEQGEKKACIWQ